MPSLTAVLKSLPLDRLPPISAVESHPGGGVARAMLLTTTRGRLFLKYRLDAPPGLFRAEAEGLAALARCTALTLPEVIAVADQWLCIRYLDPVPPTRGYWIALGEALAQLHRPRQPEFGFSGDNFCGLTPQPNPPTADGFAFFRDHRLLHQGRLAYARGLLDRRDLDRLCDLGERLADWIPVQPPVLIHGDLWQGNALRCNRGPALIDPACYWGWAEAELAMTTLFGGFEPAFYDAYTANASVPADWRQRCDLYNLYHLLNHLNLFGTSYYAQIAMILERYGHRR